MLLAWLAPLQLGAPTGYPAVLVPHEEVGLSTLPSSLDGIYSCAAADESSPLCNGLPAAARDYVAELRRAKFKLLLLEVGGGHYGL